MDHVSTHPFVKRLIIVDDDRDEHFLIKESLDECDLTPVIKTVQDGNHLLSVILNEPLPDLIILDLNMPKKSGMDCLTALRANGSYDDLPVIVLTTSTSPSDIQECYDNGASLFFSKPYDFDSMKKLIQSIMNINWSVLHPKLNRADFFKIASEGNAKNLIAYTSSN